MLTIGLLFFFSQVMKISAEAEAGTLETIASAKLAAEAAGEKVAALAEDMLT